MTDEPEIEAPAWVWQGFFGPMLNAALAWSEVVMGDAVGVLLPEAGPRAVDKAATMGMFAVQTRPEAPMATPAGMMEADPGMVGRMIGG